jgi:hypothetical protein
LQYANLDTNLLHAGAVTLGSHIRQAPTRRATQRATIVGSSKGFEERDGQSPSNQPINAVLVSLETLSKLQEQTSMLFRHQQIVESRVEGDVNPELFGLKYARTLTKGFPEPRVQGDVLVEYMATFDDKLFEEFLEDGHPSVQIGEEIRHALLASFEKLEVEKAEEGYDPENLFDMARWILAGFPSWTQIDGGRSGVESTVQNYVRGSLLKSIFPGSTVGCNETCNTVFMTSRLEGGASFSEVCKKIQAFMEKAFAGGSIDVNVSHPSSDQLALAEVIIESESRSKVNSRTSVLRHIRAIVEQEVEEDE